MVVWYLVVIIAVLFFLLGFFIYSLFTKGKENQVGTLIVVPDGDGPNPWVYSSFTVDPRTFTDGSDVMLHVMYISPEEYMSQQKQGGE